MKRSLVILAFCAPLFFLSCKKDAGDTNQAPVANEVSLSGFDQVGLIKKVTYSYTDLENDPAGVPVYKWYRYNADGTGKTVIAGANSESYTLSSADQGKRISASVSPTSSSGKSPGGEVESALSAVVDPTTTGVQTNTFTSKATSGVKIETGGWVSTDTIYKTIVSSKAFLGDGFIQYRVVKGSSTNEAVFTSAIGKTSDHDWGLQFDFAQSRLAFMENKEDVARLTDFSFWGDYYRWYRVGNTITLRHSATENGEYIIIYTSPYQSTAGEAIYFAGGTKGLDNGIKDAKISGEYVVTLN